MPALRDAPALHSQLGTTPRPPHVSPSNPDEEFNEQDIWGDEEYNQPSPYTNASVPVRSGVGHSLELHRPTHQILPFSASNGKHFGSTGSSDGASPSRVLSFNTTPNQSVEFAAAYLSGFSIADSTSGRPFPTPSRAIPSSTSTSQAFRQSRRQSAPVSIPDWSKIRGAASRRPVPSQIEDSDEDEEEEEEGAGDESEPEVIPPHELVARQYAKSVTFSVYEGVGRTLRGRDLNSFRNTILRQTGFIDG